METSSSSTTPSTYKSPLPTHDSNGRLLPGILCLHGGGSTATVFKIQCRRLIWNLGKEFRFVFAQGSIEGAPGFGMLPTFASCAPFYRWVSRRFQSGGGDVEETPTEEAQEIEDALVKVMEENGGLLSFVGIIGFSQGARLASGVLLRQLVDNRDKLGGSIFRFKFGAFIGGPYPPISIHSNVKGQDYQLLKRISTIHAWGRDDHIIDGCKELHRVCDGDKCFQMDFAGGHHMPLQDEEARKLCDLIRSVWAGSNTTNDISHNVSR